MTATDAIGLERLEALVAGDAPRNAAETRRTALLGELRGATLRAPESLRARVVAARPVPRRSFVPQLPSRRLVLVVVPAACAIAVTAAIVQGLTTGSNPHTVAPPAVVHGAAPNEKRLANPTTTFRSAVGGGAASSGSTLDSAQATLAPATSSGRLAHTDASLEVRVPDVDHLSAATRAATRIATSLGGYAQSVDYQTPQGGDGTAVIELRVPAQNVQRALARLAALGTLASQEVSVQDLEHALQVESAQ